LAEALSRQAANELLAPKGLTIGSWNELAAIDSTAQLSCAYIPSLAALELYITAQRLATWLETSGWTLMQIDNSTSPLDDEMRVLETAVFEGQKFLLSGEQRSFLFTCYLDADEESLQIKVALLIYLSLLFAWHVHLTSHSSLHGKRLALQDGIAYFFGDEVAMRSASLVIGQLAASPPAMS
jgi:hypothetical protein